MDVKTAEMQLKGMLDVAKIPAKPSYTPGDVCRILGISDRTFRRRANTYEPGPSETTPMDPECIDTYSTGGHKRVRHDELVAYLIRNQTYARINAEQPQQLSLFDI
ncbi:helix-turn-helix domain-containing protein [Desulfatibacillum aliphaticivorans]|uniref:helix-turn-helix domain-containing protein n=1 Tax=Desulfatibacillum aliphaticivorans TaxID=218208 RepID=UPI0004194DF6|nr:helix-turn-helix domain-containing protein [Desulfatibacillum aliphaticivorans]